MAARSNLVQFSLTAGDFAHLAELAKMFDAKPNETARDIVRKYLKKSMQGSQASEPAGKTGTSQ